MYFQQRNMTEGEYLDFLKVASGKKKAELVLKNANFLDVFTACFRKADIAISHGSFAGIGTYSGEKEIDMTGKTIVPGFVDAHIHIESTTVVPEVFAKEALKHGHPLVRLPSINMLRSIKCNLKSTNRKNLEKRRKSNFREYKL